MTLITDFLDKHAIMWEPIALNKKVPTIIGNYKPDPNDYKLDPTIIKMRQATPSEYIAIFTDKVAQYDIDIEDYEADEKFRSLPYFKSITKKLPHYFLLVKDPRGSRHCPVGGDLLTGQWSYCKRNVEVVNADAQIKSFSLADFEERIHPNKFSAVLKKLKKNIDNYSYDEWLKICFGLYNTAVENMFKDPLSYPTEFSKDGVKYDEKAIATINALKYKQDGIKFGTLVEIADDGEKPVKRKAPDTSTSDEYQVWKKEWEKHVFSCKQRNLVCHDLYKDDHITEAGYGTMYFVQDNNFVDLTTATYSVKNGKEQASCIKRWNLDSSKREYMDYTFAPYPFKHPNGYSYYNTWKDFELKEHKITSEIDKEHCIDVYLDFKRHLASNEENVLHYLVQQDAHIVQRPGEKPGVCTITTGSQGTGKGTDTALKIALFGQDKVLQTSDIDQVLGKFTSAISKKLVVILDEAVPKHMFEKDGPLKYLITEPLSKIESKGKDAREEHSFVRVYISTNSDNVVKVSNSDRRLFVICPDVYVPKQYEKFPKSIFELINSKDSLKAVMDYLLTIELKYKNMMEWQQNRPITKSYIEMREASIPTEIRFLHYYVTGNELNKNEFSVNLDMLYEHFKNYVGENNRFELSKDVFAKKIRVMKSVVHKREQGEAKRGRFVIFNRSAFLAELLQKNYIITDA